MDKKEQVSIVSTVSKLGLSDLPKQHAYEIIANYVTSGCFEMYFDEPIVGTNATADVEMVFEGNETAVGGLIANGYSYEHDGTKTATGVDTAHSRGLFTFVVNDYYFQDERFYPTDSEGIWHRQKLVNVDLVHFDRSQIDSFCSVKNFSKGKADQGLLKALALLAREMADNGGAKFKTGSQVNASAFKNHIISLAKKHSVTTSQLKSLDDKVKTALKEHDLNDLTGS
jgi:hypothetical protein